MLRRIVKILVWTLSIIVLLTLGLMVYVRAVAEIDPPIPPALDVLGKEVVEVDTGLFKFGNNWFKKSESGLYELYIEGKPFERGVANGRLTKELVHYQEVVFTQQIHRLVPSDFYLDILKYFVGWFNRNLQENVVPEYQLEILGVSYSASPQFDDIGPPYQRILNYHAAHDIGHALQNMSLVGCTAFATWGDASEDSTLIIGRNFDFYVGDEFARDKIIAFYRPAEGHKFAMVTFGGMTGVLSGMNDQGLTVTINAAKSDVPTESATPVTLVTREILQYASTIKEAYEIVAKRKMFVAESFLIGSAKDGKAAIIEKTPEAIDFVEPTDNYILSTNHFLGKKLGMTQLNQIHVKTSASEYRYKRLSQLLARNQKNSISKTAAILRDQRGLDDKDIGLGNEKAINQLVAHHGIIFQPEKKLMWISTAPWQLGKFVCYDLEKAFAYDASNKQEIYEQDLTIPADSFLLTPAYRQYVKFSQYRFPFNPKTGFHPDSVIKWNSNSYHAYMLAADYYYDEKMWQKAIPLYEEGLTKEVATMQERYHMEKSLKNCKEKLE
jgi:isopenicillin-N N-acyltransferase like protein